MSTSIVNIQSFDERKISFGPEKKLATGGKMRSIYYDGQPLNIMMPKMQAPFGFNHYPGENGAPDKFSVDVSFAGRDCNEKLQQFYKVVEDIQKMLVNTAMTNSMAWFNKKFPSAEVLEAMMSPSIKLPKEDQYPPRFSVKLPHRDGKFTFQTYNNKREEFDLLEMINTDPSKGKGSQVQAIVQCSNVWFVGPRFGISWKAVQLKVAEPAKLRGYAFEMEDDEEDCEDKPTPATAKPSARSTKVRADLQASSDEDDGSDALEK
jgi:hypothetical protein